MRCQDKKKQIYRLDESTRQAIFEWVRSLDVGECTLHEFKKNMHRLGFDDLPYEVERLLDHYQQTGSIVFLEFVRAFDEYFAKRNMTTGERDHIHAKFQKAMRSMGINACQRIIHHIRVTGQKRNGNLNAQNFASLLLNIQDITEEDCYEFFHLYDKNGRDQVAQEDIIQGIRGILDQSQLNNIQSLFETIATSQTGVVCMQHVLDDLFMLEKKSVYHYSSLLQSHKWIWTELSKAFTEHGCAGVVTLEQFMDLFCTTYFVLQSDTLFQNLLDVWQLCMRSARKDDLCHAPALPKHSVIASPTLFKPTHVPTLSENVKVAGSQKQRIQEGSGDIIAWT